MQTRELVGAALFGVLTAVGGPWNIPLPLVPITLQTLFTYLSGAILGARIGALSQVIYILLGAVGLPVFAQFSSGPRVLVGPTAGYLIGFVAGAYAVGWLTRRSYSYARLLLGMVAATAVIYALGVLGLMVVLSLSLTTAVLVGVVPFLVGDALKIVAAATLASRKALVNARERYFVRPPPASVPG
jgi:biotin transport system substrate-specific component